MNISYEEAMRRIAEREKKDLEEYTEMLERMDLDYERAMYQLKREKKELQHRYCKETRFPRDIYLYRGEGQILVVPLTQSMFWYRRYLGVYCSLNDSESAVKIGMKVYKSMNKKFT